MKKLYPYLLILTILLGSCSGDDSSNQVQNNNPEPTPPAVTDTTDTNPPVNMKLSKVVETNLATGYVITNHYYYQDDKLIGNKMISNDGFWDREYEIIYDDQKVQKINLYTEGELVAIFNVNYTGDKITSYETFDVLDDDYSHKMNFNYNSDNLLFNYKDYSYYNNVYFGGSTANYNEDNNVTSLNFENQYSITVLYNFEYDNSRNPYKYIQSILVFDMKLQNLSENNVTVQTEMPYNIEMPNSITRTREYQYNENNYPISCSTQGEYLDHEILIEYFYVEND